MVHGTDLGSTVKVEPPVRRVYRSGTPSRLATWLAPARTTRRLSGRESMYFAADSAMYSSQSVCAW